MDNKRKNKKSVWDNPKTPPYGYSIEFGDTTYKNTLEERIQAAKNASSIAKQTQKQKCSGKLVLKNNTRTDFEKNMTFRTVTNSVQYFENKNKQHWSSPFESIVKPTPNAFSLMPNITKNLITNVQSKFSTSDVLPTFKGGLMQRRLEAIKARKKETNAISLKCDKKTVESPKFSSNSSSSLFAQQKDIVPNCFDTNAPKRNEYKLRSTIQKNICNEIGNCDRIKNITSISNNTVTSVQNRLIKAKEEMKAKSKLRDQIDVPIKEINKKPLYACGFHQDTNALTHNIKNKTKRLNQLNHSINKNIPAMISTVKKVISHTSDVNKMVNKQLVTVQQKPVILKSMVPSSLSSTVATTKVENPNIEKTKQNELNSFSFVIPEILFAQQIPENINKKTQCNENDSMEWEIINEPNIIVDKVNDLRKTAHDYEPMEWIPDSIMHCDQVDHCLVIDTNVYLSDLNVITTILDKYIPEYGYITIVLPWKVLQELDYLKNNETSLGYQAREATRWLLQNFSNSHPRLKGQPMTEKHGMCADDAILKCAMNLKDRVNHIYLITNDKMLMVKSKVNKICTKDSKWLRRIVSVTNKNGSNIFQEAVKRYPIVESKLITKFEPHLEHIIARVLRYAVYQNNFRTFEKKMWWKVYSLTPPLNLIKFLLSLKKHWNIISPQKLFKSPQNQLDCLISFFKELRKMAPEISLSWNELYSFLKYCTEIINALPYEYYHITDVLLNDLMKARKILKEQLDSNIMPDDESLSINLLNNLNVSNDGDGSKVENILLNILSKVNTFCSEFYQTNGFTRNLPEKNKKYPIILSKSIPHYKQIEDYCQKLSNIIKVMSRIKILGFEQILESRIVINEFLKAIIEFDEELVQLSPAHVTNYLLMKDKYLFLNILIFFQNNLAAMKNLVTTSKL